MLEKTRAVMAALAVEQELPAERKWMPGWDGPQQMLQDSSGVPGSQTSPVCLCSGTLLADVTVWSVVFPTSVCTL